MTLRKSACWNCVLTRRGVTGQFASFATDCEFERDGDGMRTPFHCGECGRMLTSFDSTTKRFTPAPGTVVESVNPLIVGCPDCGARYAVSTEPFDGQEVEPWPPLCKLIRCPLCGRPAAVFDPVGESLVIRRGDLTTYRKVSSDCSELVDCPACSRHFKIHFKNGTLQTK